LLLELGDLVGEVVRTTREFQSAWSRVLEKTTLGIGFQIRAYATCIGLLDGSVSAVGQ